MSVEVTESVVLWRAEIDALDDRILSLLEERLSLSRRIQRSRMSDGGPRVASDRESQIVERYASRLGDGGTRLAGLVLEMSRGVTGRPR